MEPPTGITINPHSAVLPDFCPGVGKCNELITKNQHNSKLETAPCGLQMGLILRLHKRGKTAARHSRPGSGGRQGYKSVSLIRKNASSRVAAPLRSLVGNHWKINRFGQRCQTEAEPVGPNEEILTRTSGAPGKLSEQRVLPVAYFPWFREFYARSPDCAEAQNCARSHSGALRVQQSRQEHLRTGRRPFLRAARAA